MFDPVHHSDIQRGKIPNEAIIILQSCEGGSDADVVLQLTAQVSLGKVAWDARTDGRDITQPFLTTSEP